MLYKVNILIAK